MRKTLICLALAGCLALTGCGGAREEAAPSPSPAPGQTDPLPLRPAQAFALPVDPAGGWDPYGGSKSGNMALAGLVYEGLFELDRAFQYHPLLATGASVSEDGLVWTVRLRGGVTFSNGRALDAQTALAAVEAARGDKSVYAARLAGVKGVSAQGEDALAFTLSAPNARFPALLDFPIALAEGEAVWGTGPYVPEEGRLTARSGWWRGLSLPLDQIPLAEVSDAGALMAAFNAGLVSLAAADPTGADALGYTGACQSWEYPTSGLLYLGFQCTRGPCRSAPFRRLVSQAVDREDLVSRVLSGHAVPATLPAPADSGLYAPGTAQTLALDQAAATQALDQLGYPLAEDGLRRDGRHDLRLTLVVNSDNVYKAQLAQSIADSLGRLGVTVEVKTLAWEEYRRALERGEFDLYLAECRLTGDLDPSPFLTPGSGLYYGGFSDEALTQALAAARQTGTWEEFYEQWAQTAPLAVLCFKNAQLLTWWGQVEGAEPTQGNLFYHLENWRINH